MENMWPALPEGGCGVCCSTTHFYGWFFGNFFFWPVVFLLFAKQSQSFLVDNGVIFTASARIKRENAVSVSWGHLLCSWHLPSLAVPASFFGNFFPRWCRLATFVIWDPPLPLPIFHFPLLSACEIMQQFIKMAGRKTIGVTLMPICFSNIDFSYGSSIRSRNPIWGDQTYGCLCLVCFMAVILRGILIDFKKSIV